MRRIFISILILGIPSSSWAWDSHHYFTPWIYEGLTPELKLKLAQKFAAPTQAQDQVVFQQLIKDFHLNGSVAILPTAPATSHFSQISLADVFQQPFVEDPDGGMDENLDDSADPQGFRHWMGGEKGPTSKGFRHMYFGGWKLERPINSFQVPLKAIGESPMRVELTATRAKKLLHSSDPVWGIRILTWAMHYIQDLTQPFHAVQIPNVKMVPWGEAFMWPPTEGFHKLVHETTRTIGNYHWGFEEYVASQVKRGKDSPFSECLTHPERFSKLQFNPRTQSPRELALAAAGQSIEIAPEVGAATIGLLGEHLMAPDMDLAHGQGTPDYLILSISDAYEKPRKRLENVTCIALANAALGSRYLVQWAFEP